MARFLFILMFYCGLAACNNPDADPVPEATEHQGDSIVISNLEFGLNLDSFLVYQGQIGRNQFLADILLGAYRVRKSQKLASLLFAEAFGGMLYGPVDIRHLNQCK